MLCFFDGTRVTAETHATIGWFRSEGPGPDSRESCCTNCRTKKSKLDLSGDVRAANCTFILERSGSGRKAMGESVGSCPQIISSRPALSYHDLS